MSAALLDWSAASLPLAGETSSGDGHTVQLGPWGALVAVADGLGHGDEAAAATRVALATLERHAGDPLQVLLERCHGSLRDTRGVALGIARFDPSAGTMAWAGIGNVAGFLHRAARGGSPRLEQLMMRAGVVGDRLPVGAVLTTPVARGDTLVFATDGILAQFVEAVVPFDTPRGNADRILAEYAKRTDDALVVVARYLGGTL